MGLIILVLALVFLTAGCQEPITPNNSETNDDGDEDNDYIDEIISALENSKDGTEKENPVVLNLDMDMGKMSSGESNWQKLLAAIGDAQKFVSLDLSACTLEEHPNPYFHPYYNVSTGKDKIVRLILPDAASDITGGSGASDYAFKHFSALEYVKGKNITHIGSWAFYDCRKLKEIDFPAVTEINQGVFYGCVSLINVDLPNAVLIGNNAFSDCSNLVSVNAPKAETIDQYAFYNCTNLTEADFPLVEVLGNFAFNNCSSLTDVDFPFVKTINPNAFMDCKNLIEVKFSSATIIGDHAFSGCSSLKKASFLADPVRTSDEHPLKDWLDFYNEGGWNGPAMTKPVSKDSVIIHSGVFNGCFSLETLDIRNAWNVFFAVNSLVNIGTHLDIYLYDDSGIPDENKKRSYGHPQTEWFLGGEPVGSTRTVESIKFILPIIGLVNSYNENKPGYLGIAKYVPSIGGASATVKKLSD